MPPIIWPNANCGPQLSRAKYPAATKLLKAPEPGKSSLRWQLLAPSAPPVSSPPSPEQLRSKRAKHEQTRSVCLRADISLGFIHARAARPPLAGQGEFVKNSAADKNSVGRRPASA